MQLTHYRQLTLRGLGHRFPDIDYYLPFENLHEGQIEVWNDLPSKSKYQNKYPAEYEWVKRTNSVTFRLEKHLLQALKDKCKELCTWDINKALEDLFATEKKYKQLTIYDFMEDKSA
jgi:hypothetical protein